MHYTADMKKIYQSWVRNKYLKFNTCCIINYVYHNSKGRKSPVPKKANVSQLDQSQNAYSPREVTKTSPDLPSINERLGTYIVLTFHKSIDISLIYLHCIWQKNFINCLGLYNVTVIQLDTALTF